LRLETETVLSFETSRCLKSVKSHTM